MTFIQLQPPQNGVHAIVPDAPNVFALFALCFNEHRFQPTASSALRIWEPHSLTFTRRVVAHQFYCTIILQRPTKATVLLENALYRPKLTNSSALSVTKLISVFSIVNHCLHLPSSFARLAALDKDLPYPLHT